MRGHNKFRIEDWAPKEEDEIVPQKGKNRRKNIVLLDSDID